MHRFPFSGFDISYAAYGGIGKVFFGDTPNPVRGGFAPCTPFFVFSPIRKRGSRVYSIPRQDVKRPAPSICCMIP